MESLPVPLSAHHVQFCCFSLLCLGMLILFLPTVLSVPKVPAYHTLDVATLLRKNDGTVAGGVEYKKESKTKKPRRTASSLEVVHSDTLLPANASSSYEQRLKETLRRDAARIRGLEQQIERSLKSRLNKSARSNENMPADFGGGVVSGVPLGSGEYLTRIGVGTPTTKQYLLLDTGSDVTWIQCKPCRKCYPQQDPIFNPYASTSFSLIVCNSDICSELGSQGGCASGRCIYQLDYGDGSRTVGNLAFEKLTFGNVNVANVAIGCGHYSTGLFTGAAGLLGLGAGQLSFPSQLGTQAGGKFSYCLADRDAESSGALDFGPESIPDGSIFTPMLINSHIPTFYYLSLAAISVGGSVLESIPTEVFQIDDTTGLGGVIIDSGTTITHLQTAAYNAVRDAFVEGTQDLPRTDENSLFDTCYDLSGLDSVMVPTVGFHFSNGETLILPGNNHLIPVDNSGTHCFAFVPTDSNDGISIMGNIQQQHIGVSFDSANSLIGFALDQC